MADEGKSIKIVLEAEDRFTNDLSRALTKASALTDRWLSKIEVGGKSSSRQMESLMRSLERQQELISLGRGSQSGEQGSGRRDDMKFNMANVLRGASGGVGGLATMAGGMVGGAVGVAAVESLKALISALATPIKSLDEFNKSIIPLVMQSRKYGASLTEVDKQVNLFRQTQLATARWFTPKEFSNISEMMQKTLGRFEPQLLGKIAEAKLIHGLPPELAAQANIRTFQMGQKTETGGKMDADTLMKMAQQTGIPTGRRSEVVQAVTQALERAMATGIMGTKPDQLARIFMDRFKTIGQGGLLFQTPEAREAAAGGTRSLNQMGTQMPGDAMSGLVFAATQKALNIQGPESFARTQRALAEATPEELTKIEKHLAELVKRSVPGSENQLMIMRQFAERFFGNDRANIESKRMMGILSPLTEQKLTPAEQKAKEENERLPVDPRRMKELERLEALSPHARIEPRIIKQSKLEDMEKAIQSGKLTAGSAKDTREELKTELRILRGGVTAKEAAESEKRINLTTGLGADREARLTGVGGVKAIGGQMAISEMEGLKMNIGTQLEGITTSIREGFADAFKGLSGAQFNLHFDGVPREGARPKTIDMKPGKTRAK